MATLSVQEFGETGNDLTLSAASAGGDQFANTGEEFLVIKSDNASSVTVTITAQNTSFDDSVWGESVKQDQTVSLSGNGGIVMIGPFPRRAYNDGSGNVQVGYSDATSVEIAAIKHS